MLFSIAAKLLTRSASFTGAFVQSAGQHTKASISFTGLCLVATANGSSIKPRVGCNSSDDNTYSPSKEYKDPHYMDDVAVHLSSSRRRTRVRAPPSPEPNVSSHEGSSPESTSAAAKSPEVIVIESSQSAAASVSQAPSH